MTARDKSRTPPTHPPTGRSKIAAIFTMYHTFVACPLRRQDPFLLLHLPHHLSDPIPNPSSCFRHTHDFAIRSRLATLSSLLVSRRWVHRCDYVGPLIDWGLGASDLHRFLRRRHCSRWVCFGVLKGKRNVTLGRGKVAIREPFDRNKNTRFRQRE